MDKWLNSNNKAMVMGETEINIYGNVAMARTKIGDTESVSYTEITDDSINMYSNLYTKCQIRYTLIDTFCLTIIL